jgi:signal transduction histidine kinase/CheY-like chemotaxis protein
MSAALANRVLRGSRVALLGLLLLLLLASASDAKELCTTQTGDDPSWSRPDFNDAAWRRVDVRSTWRDQNRQGYDGIVWFRCTVPLGDGARNELGVFLGPPAYGGYEAYAGGRLIGRSRGWSSALAFRFPEVFRVPADAINSDGTVALTLRVRRIGWASDQDPESAPVSGRLTFGFYSALADRARVDWAGRLLNEVPLLILAALFGIVFLRHLLLFARRRKQTEHLWFSLLALVFAINTFASTYWIYEVTASRGIATRISDMTGHLAAALAIQFLWTFFSRPISPALRAYQLSHLALAGFVGLWPDFRPIVMSGTARWLWLLPLLVIAAVFVLREGWRGDGEARLIAAGGLVMVLVETVEVSRNVFGLHLPIDFSLAPFGFGAVIVAMSVALSLRFRRVHDELDRLRLSLEDEVRERTRELEGSRDDAVAGLRVKSEFLANISHEIRTPMNGVIGVAELLSYSVLTPEQRSQVETIHVNAQSLLTLLDDIIDFSSLESSALRVERRPFRVRTVVEECLQIMTPLAREKELLLASSIADGAVQSISGDRRRTRQVLLNLLNNAIKFTVSGRIDVSMGSRTLEDGRIEVRFSVADSGRGMAGDDLPRLFVAFQQLESSSSRRHGGVGLGLAISKRLTELMGGNITVETTPGRGSTFHFTIVGEPAELPSSSNIEPRVSPQGPLRVLLAEDDVVNRIVVLDMLEQLGHQADSVNNGVEALEALDRQAYDVVLLDLQMPGLDGYEVTHRIRSVKGTQIYIIALTAHALSDDRERCLAAGMNDYLTKPVRLSELRNALAGVV